jgi:hypothetical protein
VNAVRKFWFHKSRDIYWLAERPLASQRMCSMELLYTLPSTPRFLPMRFAKQNIEYISLSWVLHVQPIAISRFNHHDNTVWSVRTAVTRRDTEMFCNKHQFTSPRNKD